jgi:hypothetical protein
MSLWCMKLEIWVCMSRSNEFLYRFFTYIFYCYGERELNGKRRGNRREVNKQKFTSCHPDYGNYTEKLDQKPPTSQNSRGIITFFHTPLSLPQSSSIAFCMPLSSPKSWYYQMLDFNFRLTIIIT